MKKNVLLYSLICFLMIVFSQATLEVNPFGIGFYMALVYLDFNVIILSPMLILSEYLFDFSGYSILCAVVCVIIHILYRIFCNKKKLYPVFAVVSLVGCGFETIKNYGMLEFVLTICFICFFAFICYTFISPLKIHRLKYKLLDSEIVCSGVMLTIFGLGLAGIKISDFSPLGCFIVFAVCVAGKCISSSAALVCGISMGLGGAIYNYSPQTLAIYCFVSIITILFLPAPKILICPVVATTYAMFAFYFEMHNNDALIPILSVVCGGILYTVFPKKALKIVSEFFGAPKSRAALRFMVNKNRRDMGNDLLQISEIFGEMSIDMFQTTISDKKLNQLKDAVTEHVCEHCANRDKCMDANVFDEINKLIECSLENDRANILNASPILGEYCINIVSLIDYVNELLIRYDGIKKKNDIMNTAKKVVSSQLKGMSDILRELAMKQASPIQYAEDLERKISDDLTYRGVIVGEVWVKDDGELIIVALKTTLKENTVKKALKIMLKKEFIIKNQDSVMPGWTVITATPTPVYDAVFSSCNNCKQENSCGDTHSFMRLSDGRFMAALCDGMGCGKEAREFSSRTLSLIENFYRAGFEHNLVLDSVNKFFTLLGEEKYGAMDIVVVDLNTLLTDVIKIGSPAIYIKNSSQLSKIEGSALPIGVLEEMKPSIKTIKLKAGDTVVMTSDGVADCFENDELAMVINENSGLPKELCASIINSAVNVKKVHTDDMTAIAFRIFQREQI